MKMTDLKMADLSSTKHDTNNAITLIIMMKCITHSDCY